MLCKGKEVVLIYWLGICSLNYWLFGIPFIFCIKQRRAFVIHDYKMVWKPCLYSHSTVLWLSNHQLRKMIILIGCETGRRRRINWPFLPQRTVTMGWVVWTVCPNITKCNDNFLVTRICLALIICWSLQNKTLQARIHWRRDWARSDTQSGGFSKDVQVRCQD